MLWRGDGGCVVLCGLSHSLNGPYPGDFAKGAPHLDNPRICPGMTMTPSAWIQPITRILSRDSVEEGPPLSLQKILLIGIAASSVHGFTMGLYAWLDRGGEGLLQCLLSALKVPLLFLVTGIITLPSLLVFSQLLALPLRAAVVAREAAMLMALSSITLASLSPVLAFFSLNTRSYPFIVLLNVLFFTIAGSIGLARLARGLQVSLGEPAAVSLPLTTEAEVEPAEGERPPVAPRPAAARRQANKGAALLRLWFVVFALVGCQSAWMLRPFVLAHDAPFEVFCERDSHFFAAVLQAIQQLFGG